MVEETVSKKVAAHRSETNGAHSSSMAAEMYAYDIFEMEHRNRVVPQLPGPGDVPELHNNARA